MPCFGAACYLGNCIVDGKAMRQKIFHCRRSLRIKEGLSLQWRILIRGHDRVQRNSTIALLSIVPLDLTFESRFTTAVLCVSLCGRVCYQRLNGQPDFHKIPYPNFMKIRLTVQSLSDFHKIPYQNFVKIWLTVQSLPDFHKISYQNFMKIPK